VTYDGLDLLFEFGCLCWLIRFLDHGPLPV
jgi:hypothetical protein